MEVKRLELFHLTWAGKGYLIDYLGIPYLKILILWVVILWISLLVLGSVCFLILILILLLTIVVIGSIFLLMCLNTSSHGMVHDLLSIMALMVIMAFIRA